VSWNGWECPAPRPPPGFGEHNREILGGWLALADDEIERLREDGVI